MCLLILHYILQHNIVYDAIQYDTKDSSSAAAWKQRRRKKNGKKIQNLLLLFHITEARTECVALH